MDVLAGSIRFMGPRVCRHRRLASYTLVGSRFQRRPSTTSDLDTTTLIVEVEPFVAVKDYEWTAQRAVMSYHKLPAIGDIALFLQTRRGGFCCNRCIQTALALRRKEWIGDAIRKLALAGTYYERRDRVSCLICGDIKKCIRFL